MRVDSILTLKKDELTKREWSRLFNALTFTDADDNEVTAFDYVPAKDIVRIPRGAWNLIPKHVSVTDLRARPRMRKFSYVKELDGPGYEGQHEAVLAMFEHGQGQVIAPPGRGKTELAYAFIAACSTPTLVVVHTHDLFKQWIDRAEESVPGLTVGRIQGKTCQVGDVTIAMAQTLKKYIRHGGKFWRQFGCVIVDETHHAAAETWEWLLNSCPAHYRFGLSASQKRSDGRQPLVNFNIGPVIYKLTFQSAVPMTVVPVFTKHRSRYGGAQWSRLIRDLVRDEDRNALIAKVTAGQIREGRTVLVLSRQIVHLELIHDHLRLEFDFDEGWTQGIKTVTGRLPKSHRDDMISKLRDGSLTCILGTQLFEEGVDIPRLDCIVLAFPGTVITVLQKVGRGARIFEGKTDTLIFDIVDEFVPVCAKQYLERKTWYQGSGIKVKKVVVQDGSENKGKKKSGADLLRSLTVSRPRRAA